MKDCAVPISFQIGADTRQSATFSADELSKGWIQHQAGDPLTKFLEEYSQSFILAGIPDENALLFVRMVCAWGGLRGNNFLRFRDSVTKSEKRGRSLGAILRDAKDLSEDGKFQDAIRAFDGMKGLGVSFRSKVLRFLCPDKAAILDSIIRRELGYKNSANGYEAFVTDCIRIRDKLNRKRYLHPLKRPWQTTDVEMGIFINVKKSK